MAVYTKHLTHPRRSKNRYGKYFINFSPAISDEAGKAIREEIRSWKLHLRSDKAIEDLSRMFNPKIRGWLHCKNFARAILAVPKSEIETPEQTIARLKSQKRRVERKIIDVKQRMKEQKKRPLPNQVLDSRLMVVSTISIPKFGQ